MLGEHARGTIVSSAPVSTSASSMLAGEGVSLAWYWSHRARYLRAGGFDTALALPAAPLALGGGAGGEEWMRQAQDILEVSLPALLRRGV